MSQITILSLYVLAAGAFTASRLPRFSAYARPQFGVAAILVAAGIVIHGKALFGLIHLATGIDLTVGNAISMIGFELAVIGLIASLEPTLRGISGGLVFLAALTVLLMGPSGDATGGVALAWQVRAHVLIALLSYGLLTVGTIVALYALVQERRLQAARLSPVNQLFAPLETTEKLLFGVAAAGFGAVAAAQEKGADLLADTGVGGGIGAKLPGPAFGLGELAGALEEAHQAELEAQAVGSEGQKAPDDLELVFVRLGFFQHGGQQPVIETAVQGESGAHRGDILQGLDPPEDLPAQKAAHPRQGVDHAVVEIHPAGRAGEHFEHEHEQGPGIGVEADLAAGQGLAPHLACTTGVSAPPQSLAPEAPPHFEVAVGLCGALAGAVLV